MSEFSRAREAANVAIHRAVNENLERDPKLRRNLPKLFKLVAKAYPFARKEPYLGAWRAEIKIIRAELEAKPIGADPIDRPCIVCGAKPGKPCTSVGENDNLAPEFMAASGQHNAIRGNKAPGRVAKTLKKAVMHELRKQADPHASLIGVVGAA